MREREEALQLMYAIARHFRAHPHACDTLDGVSRWWLDDGAAPVRALQVALDLLENKGIVEAVHAADGRTRYRLAASFGATTRLERLLASPEEPFEGVDPAAPSSDRSTQS